MPNTAGLHITIQRDAQNVPCVVTKAKRLNAQNPTLLDTYTSVFTLNPNGSPKYVQKTHLTRTPPSTSTKRNPPCSETLLTAIRPIFDKPDGNYFIPFEMPRGSMWDITTQQSIEHGIGAHLSHAFPSREASIPSLKFFVAQFMAGHSINL